jgi:hypothetical protein
VAAVLARMRRDVNDAWISSAVPDPYPAQQDTYKQSDKTLIIRTFVNGGVQTVVWDFSKPTEVHRIAYNVGIPKEWVALGLPDDFAATIDSLEIPDRPYGVRIKAYDKKGVLAVDEYLQPRAHGKQTSPPAQPPTPEPQPQTSPQPETPPEPPPQQQ